MGARLELVLGRGFGFAGEHSEELSYVNSAIVVDVNGSDKLFPERVGEIVALTSQYLLQLVDIDKPILVLDDKPQTEYSVDIFEDVG